MKEVREIGRVVVVEVAGVVAGAPEVAEVVVVVFKYQTFIRKSISSVVIIIILGSSNDRVALNDHLIKKK